MLKLMGNQLFSVVFQVKLLVSLLYLAAFKVCCLGPGNSGICQCANFWISSQLDSFQCLLKVDPTYRPCLESSNYLGLGSGALPVAGSDLALSPVQWSSHVAEGGNYLKVSEEGYFVD